MDSETPVTYAVEIVSVRDETAKNEVAGALTRVAKNIPENRIRSRLDRLPWVVARTGNKENAERLVKMCNRRGAEVEVTPPLFQATAFVTTQRVDQALPDQEPLPEGPPPSTSNPETAPRPDEYFPSPPLPARQTPEPKSLPLGGQPATVEQHTKVEDAWFSEPLSVTGILNRTFDICKTHFWNLAATSGVFWLVFGAVRIASTTAEEQSSIFDAMLAGPGFVASMVLMLGLFVQQGAMVYAVSGIYLGREVPIKESYSAAWRKARRLILTGLLVTLALVGMMIVCATLGMIVFAVFALISGIVAVIVIIPTVLALFCVAFYVFIKFGLCVEIIMIEDLAYSECMRKSWSRLSGQATTVWPKGYFTRFAICFVITVLVYACTSILLVAPGAAMFAAGMETAGTAVNQLFQIIGDILGGTFGSVCGVVFYYDIRSRKEGFDLQQLASQVSR